jgi:hypothetical protein
MPGIALTHSSGGSSMVAPNLKETAMSQQQKDALEAVAKSSGGCAAAGFRSGFWGVGLSGWVGRMTS